MFDPEVQKCNEYGADLLTDIHSVQLPVRSAGDKETHLFMRCVMGLLCDKRVLITEDIKRRRGHLRPLV